MKFSKAEKATILAGVLLLQQYDFIPAHIADDVNREMQQWDKRRGEVYFLDDNGIEKLYQKILRNE